MLKKTFSTYLFSLLLLLFMFFALYLVPEFGHKPFDDGVRLLDTRFWYSVSDVDQLFAKLNEDGREAYKSFLLWVDFFYPVAYGGLLMLSIALLVKAVFRERKRFLKLSLLPVGAVLFDYFENFCTLYLLDVYPQISSTKVALGAFSTATKWIFVFLSSLVLIILIFTALVSLLRSIKTKRSPTP